MRAASLSEDLEQVLAPAARLRLLQLIERVEVHAERVDVHLRRSHLVAGATSAMTPVVLTSAAKLVRGPKEVQL